MQFKVPIINAWNMKISVDRSNALTTLFHGLYDRRMKEIQIIYF